MMCRLFVKSQSENGSARVIDKVGLAKIQQAWVVTRGNEQEVKSVW